MTEQFCFKENVYWRKSTHVFYLITSVLGAASHYTRSNYQELIKNRGFMRDRKQHIGILLLNLPWQRGNTWESFQMWNPQDLFFPEVTNFLLACFLLSFHIPTTNSSSNFQQNIKMLSIPSTSLDKLKVWFFFFFWKTCSLEPPIPAWKWYSPRLSPS